MRPATCVFAVLVLLAACTSSGGGTTSPPATGPAPTPPATSPASAPGSSPAGAQPADWPTYHGDLARTGVSATMPAVRGPLKLTQSIALDEAVYASPIVVGGITVVATENNSVYGFDAGFHQLWQTNLGRPSPGDERECGNIDPLGITGTPVFDASSGLVYVSPELGGPPRHRLVALDPKTGTTRWTRSIDLPGVETRAMQQRGALTVTGGRVWVPFGGLAGDCGGYKGRVVGVPLDGSGAAIAYTVPTTREAGIWTPPGPAIDASGNLFVAVGNGESLTGDRYDYSDSVLKISPDATLLDSFSPTTWATDNEADLDLGSQGPALVGDRWVFIAGKSGTAYVLRQNDLGGIGGQASKAAVCASYGGTAVVGDLVFVPCQDGVRAVRIDSSGRMDVRWHAAEAITGSPVVGGGRVWSLDPGGILHALDPATGASRAQVRVGATSRFATPALSGRSVLIGTLTGLAVVTTS